MWKPIQKLSACNRAVKTAMLFPLTTSEYVSRLQTAEIEIVGKLYRNEQRMHSGPVFLLSHLGKNVNCVDV